MFEYVPIGDIDYYMKSTAEGLERWTPDIVGSTLLRTKYFLILILGSSVASCNEQEGNKKVYNREDLLL